MVNVELENISHPDFYGINILLNDCSYRQSHFHFDMEFIFVLEAEGHIKIQEHSFKLTSGQGLLINSTQLHEIIGSPQMKLLIFQFSSNIFHHIFPQIENIQFDNAPIHIKPNSELIRYIHQASINYFDKKSNPLVTYGYLSLLISSLMDIFPHQFLNNSETDRFLENTERLSRIATYIQKNYLSNIKLEDVSARESLSITYFSHYFKKNFGITFKEYINNLRCEYAKQMLVNSRESLINIAYGCGFSDVRSLNSNFIARYQISPKDFRNKKGEDKSKVNSEFYTDTQFFYSPEEALKVIQRYFVL